MHNRKTLAIAMAATLLTGTLTPVAAQAQTTDATAPSNVIDAGGVNVRSLGDVTANEAGVATVEYEISFSPMQSSNYGETSVGTTVLIPRNAENVNFELIGTRTTPEPFGLGTPVTLTTPVEMQILDNIVRANQALAPYASTGFRGGVPTLEQFSALQSAGASQIPAGVMKFNIPDLYREIPRNQYIPAEADAYGISSAVLGPVAVKVSFDVQAADADSFVPVRAFQNWKCNGSSLLFIDEVNNYGPFNQGCQNFMEERVQSSEYANWTSIFDDGVDAALVTPAGITGTVGCAPTEDTGQWWTIGADADPTQANFNYAYEYRLGDNEDLTYIAPLNEDMCDQTAVKVTPYTEPAPVVEANAYDDSFTYPGVPVVVQTKDTYIVAPETKFRLKGEVPKGWEILVDEKTGQITFTAPESAAGPTRHVFEIETFLTNPDGSETETGILTAGVQVLATPTNPTFYIDADGNLWVKTGDTEVNLGKVVGEKGDQGVPGQNGHDGADGADGVGIKDVTNGENGTIVIELTDGNTIVIDAPESNAEGSPEPTIKEIIKGVGVIIIVFVDGTRVEVPVSEQGVPGEPGEPGRDGRDGRDGLDASSQIPERCLPTVAGLAVPVALAGVVGAIGQLDMPGLKLIQRQMAEISGEFNRNFGFGGVNDRNRHQARGGFQLFSQQDMAKIGGGLAAVAGVALVSALLYNACAPTKNEQ